MREVVKGLTSMRGCKRGAGRRFSYLPPAAAMPAAGRRGVVHVLLALGNGQVIECLVKGRAVNVQRVRRDALPYI